MQRRGRWKADKSVQRYTRTHLWFAAYPAALRVHVGCYCDGEGCRGNACFDARSKERARKLFGRELPTHSPHTRASGIADAAPAIVTALTMPLTFSIANGIALGFITYAVIKALSGRWSDLNASVVTIAVVFVLKFMFLDAA